MKLAARALLALAAALVLAASEPAPAAPKSSLYTNFQQALTSYATSEADAGRKAALEAAAALFDNTSNSLAADLVDASNAVKKLEAAFGTSDGTVSAFLDDNILAAYVAVYARANQAYVGAQQKELARNNYRAIARIAKTHLAQVRKAGKAFPEVADPSISRVRRFKALVTLEKYGAGLAKRYKVALNEF
jgi:hypothetical protein